MDAIPAELREHARWVSWRPGKDDKKVPYAAGTSRSIDATNPENWRTFDTAVAGLAKATGIGFALGQNGSGPPFAGVDLDKCRNPETGEIEKWAQRIINDFKSYTEVSPSRTGVKIFVKGSLPDDAVQGKRHKLEMYDSGRYFTVTGHHLEGTPLEIADRETELQKLHAFAWGGDLVVLCKIFGLYRQDRGDKIDIWCPWRNEHTTPDGDKDASLFRTDGEISGFKCFHGHCASRNLGDVKSLFGIKNGREHRNGHRTITLTFADTITPKPVHWLWEGRIPLKAFSLLAGREGIGKTTCAYSLAADVTCGRLAGKLAGQPRKVIVVAGEDSWEHTIVPRLMAAGADRALVARVDVTTSEDVPSMLSLPDDIKALAGVVQEHEVALILLDPLISRLDRKLDTHKDADVRGALEPLCKLADMTGAAVLGIIHVNKSSSTDPLNMVMGSRAFTAIARAVLFVSEDLDIPNQRVLSLEKNNLGRCDLPSLTFEIENAIVATTNEGEISTGKLRWTGETEKTARDCGADNNTRTKDAAQWLQEFLDQRSGAARSADIKDAGSKIGHSESTLKRARNQIGIVSESIGFPRVTWWRLRGANVDLVALNNAVNDAAEAEAYARGEL